MKFIKFWTKEEEGNYRLVITEVMKQIVNSLSNRIFRDSLLSIDDPLLIPITPQTNSQIKNVFSTHLNDFYEYMGKDTKCAIKEIGKVTKEKEKEFKALFRKGYECLREIKENNSPSQRIEIEMLKTEFSLVSQWKVGGVEIGNTLYGNLMDIWKTIKQHNNRLVKLNFGKYSQVLEVLMDNCRVAPTLPHDLKREERCKMVKEEYWKSISHMFEQIENFPFSSLVDIKRDGRWLSICWKEYECVFARCMLGIKGGKEL